MKKYKFNGEVYTDLESLSQALIENFDVALEQVFIKPKKLVLFVKNFDKVKAKKIVDIFETTKYKGNVLSFIIFTISKDPIVLVNGVNLDFNDFIKVIGFNRENKAIKAFMEDNGMSKTYATMNIDKKIPNDSYYIEKTFDDDFTFKYISNYLRIDYTENLNGFISNILINNDERFKRACDIVLSDNFQMVLAHKTNFKAAYNVRYSQTPIFEALKILSFEFNKDDLLKIVNDSFFYWLLDNYDKYIFHKKETLALKTQLKKLSKEFEKELTYEERIELSKKLYEIYLLFAEGYKNKEISVNAKKYNVDQYALDKPYCKTLISVDYMKNHPVVLTTDEELKAMEAKANEVKANEVKEDTEEIVDNENTDEILENAEIEVIKDEKPNEKEIKYAKKRQKRLSRMTKYILVTSIFVAAIISLIYFLFPMLPEKVMNFDISKYLNNFKANQSKLMIFVFMALGIIFVNFILIIIINIRNEATNKAINLYLKQESINNKDTNLNTEDQKSLRYMERNYGNIVKRIRRKERIITSICLSFAAISYAVFALLPLVIYKGDIKDLYLYISAFGSLGIGLLIGLLFTKKGAFSAFLVNLIAIGLTGALIILL